jgi:broad specificity phosphatase PhoE
MATTVILIRHGETEKNVVGKLHDTNDPETLTPLGIQQIEQTAYKLTKQHLSKIYFSKEKRAQESAQIIADITQIAATSIEGMQERNWGQLSGKPWNEIREILDPMSLEERYHYVPPQGESWQSFEERLIKAITTILSQHEGESIAVISHGGAIRALMPYLLNVPKEESFKYDPDNASITAFKFANGTFNVITVNDTTHLTSNIT